VALGFVALAFGILYLSGLIERTAVIWAVGVVLLASGSGLVVGIMTPVASLFVALCVLGITFSFLPQPPLAALCAKLTALLIVIAAIGISLLGPGAFSLDGYLFGRREIVIPPGPPHS
jgi:uncharacterized membrane protein YphA (DoxX/SURF4 family)